MKPDKPHDSILEYIKDNFMYEPLTGDLYRYSIKWQEYRLCTNDHSSGRLRVGIKYRSYYVSNVCWYLHYGEWPEVEIDHEDGDGHNNKIDNLRKSGHSSNSRNKDNRISNIYHGVSYHEIGGKFRYRFSVDGKKYEVYGFSYAREAAEAREKHLDALEDKFCKRNKFDV